MDTCELCGKTDDEADIGDFNGYVLCYECAAKQPEIQNWLAKQGEKL